MYRRDRVKGSGGILLYIKDSIAASRRNLRGKFVESMEFKIKIGQRQFALVTAYKPPELDNATFRNELSQLLDEATDIPDNVIRIGDLNSDILHLLDNKKKGQCLLDICDICNLDGLINVPTRRYKTKGSCPKNIPALIKQSGAIVHGLSDHELVYTVLKTRLMRPQAQIIIRRSLKTFDLAAFQQDLSIVPFFVSYVFDDPEDVYWCWYKLMIKS